VVRGRDHTEWSLVGDSWTLFCDGLFCLLQVIGLWVLFALPVWSAAYKQAGCDTPSWFGISQVAEDAPGIGLVAKAAPDYDGPSFREVLILHLKSRCSRHRKQRTIGMRSMTPVDAI
jgi:hypothetical protein